jgi:hypothetical protein
MMVLKIPINKDTFAILIYTVQNLFTMKLQLVLSFFLLSFLAIVSCDEKETITPMALSGEFIGNVNGKVIKMSTIRTKITRWNELYIDAWTDDYEYHFNIIIGDTIKDGEILFKSSSRNEISYSPPNPPNQILGGFGIRSTGSMETGILNLDLDEENKLISGVFKGPIVLQRSSEEFVTVKDVSFSNIPITDELPSYKVELKGFYFFANINGKEAAVVGGFSHTVGADSYGDQSRYDLLAADYNWGSSFSDDDVVFGARIRFIVKEDNLLNYKYTNFMKVRELPYSKTVDKPEDNVEGVIVYYKDSAGVIWSTDFGSGDQTSSSFQITERKDDTFYSGVVKGKFSCTVYNISGDSKLLENGQFVGKSIWID